MHRFSVSALLALVLPVAAGADTVDETVVRRLRIEQRGIEQRSIVQRVVIRIPRVSPAPPTPRIAPQTVSWKEKKGPACLPTGTLAGALIAKPGRIDLVMVGGDRFRAELGDDCPTLGFYSGFYLKPSGDGQVCAGRDAVRARSGRACPIQRFRRLEARRERRPD